MLYVITIILIAIVFSIYMSIRYDASFGIEITSPKVKAVVGFEYWEEDDEDGYNTLKIHLVWLSFRWDWVS